jgi:probable phosphoglycerate mutase
MERCLRTGQIIAEPFGLEARPLAALNDIDYGQWQGLTPEEARARWPQEVELWYRRPDLARIAGGETLQHVLARAADGLRMLVDRHPGGTLVLVGHDCLNRVILLHALELPLSRYWDLGQAPCAINEIDATSEGSWCGRSTKPAIFRACRRSRPSGPLQSVPTPITSASSRARST